MACFSILASDPIWILLWPLSFWEFLNTLKKQYLWFLKLKMLDLFWFGNWSEWGGTWPTWLCPWNKLLYCFCIFKAYLKNEQCYIEKSPVYHFYEKKDISEDFRICISVRLREPSFGTLLGICFCNALLLSLSMFFSYCKRFFFLLLLEDMSTANNKKIRNIFIFNMFIFTKCWF